MIEIEESADGKTRRKPLRHVSMLSKEENLSCFVCLETLVRDFANMRKWFQAKDIFVEIPKSLENTSMYVIYQRCFDITNDEIQAIYKSRKLLGILLRDYIYSHDKLFAESFLGSQVKYYKYIDEKEF